ncbi:MAG: response regulator transcription factor [Actinomycetota bacterium]
MAAQVRVLVVDDQTTSSQELALLLDRQPGIELVAHLDSGEDAVRVCRDRGSDVVLMDLDTPGIDGIETTRQIREVCPETKVVVLTASIRPAAIASVLAAGACGYVPKAHAADEVIDVVHRAASGEIVMPTSDLPLVLEHLHGGAGPAGELGLQRLTSRESDVLRAMAAGQTADVIAKHLGISPLTVQSHVKSILAKLGVHSKIEAVTLAWRHGLTAASRTA